MKLKYSPYRIFENGKTPQSLYARKKWLGEEDSESWKNDFKEAVAEILDKDIWDDNDIIYVLKKLFDLHLTVRDENSEIEDAVEKLLKKAERIFRNKDRNIISKEEIEYLPFASSESCYFIPSAVLFTAGIFNMDKKPVAESLYNTLINYSSEAKEDESLLIFRHNLFRALAVNPSYSNNPETVKILKMMISLQSEEGDFRGKIPFFQAVNAAAHISSEDSDLFFNSALPFLVNNQNSDGSWGEGESKEWNTFLAVHALRNKSVI